MNGEMFLAGIFCGVALVLFFACYWLNRRYEQVDLERKLWTNKALIRDGHGRIFPDVMIGMPDADLLKPQAAPFVRKTPLEQGKANLLERVRTEKQVANGSKLPDAIQARIRAAADERKGLSTI